MIGTKYFLLLFVALIQLQDCSSGRSFYQARKDNKICPGTPRPVNKSISACWSYTKRLETTLIEQAAVKMDICLETGRSFDNHQLGVELMRTSKTIYCFGVFNHNRFSGDEFIRNINSIWTSTAEIIEDTNVCVTEGDYKNIDCMDLDLSDFNTLYFNVAEQARLLESLYIGIYGLY
jgi:hypothetical protein